MVLGADADAEADASAAVREGEPLAKCAASSQPHMA
jgi:hypothetical protein